MNFFNKIFGTADFEETSNQLSRAKPENPPSQPPEETYIGYISYLLKKDGSVDIRSSCVPSIDNIDMYAALLHIVASGKLKSETAGRILMMAENPEFEEFLDLVLDRWETFATTEEDLPIVRPLNALRVKDED